MTTKVSVGKGGDVELFSKKASFIQHSLPGLQAGAYQVKLQQELKDSNGKLITTTGSANDPAPLATITRKFGVKGPKYSLDANVIQSVYPPVSSVGGFSNSIAHVVLNQEKLPWLRSPYLPQNVVTPKEHEYTANGTIIHYYDDQPTWMMVLTLSPGDLGGIDPSTLIKRGTVLDLVPSTLTMNDKNGVPVAGNLPSNAYSIFSYLLQPPVSKSPVSPEFGNTSADPCTYIDVPATLFNRLVPSMEDLEMMAHVRAVEMDAKPLRQDETVQPVQQYGLVLGNRLPETFTGSTGDSQTTTAMGNNLALLISLESMELALRGNQSAQNQYPIITANGGSVRLIILNQWSFTSWESTSYQFEHILKGLNGRDPNSENSKVLLDNPLFRIPNPPQFTSPTEEQTVVQEMIELGYTPMNHLTRVPATGNPPMINTVSWYRGPFIPFPQNNDTSIMESLQNSGSDADTVYSADALLRFDPKIGMYDTSYAAAWQLGQLTALQNKAFSVPYFRWQKANAQNFKVALENNLLQGGNPALFARSEKLAGIESRPETGRQIYHSVLDLLTKKD